MLMGRARWRLRVGATASAFLIVVLAGVALAQVAIPQTTRQVSPYLTTRTVVATDGTTLEESVINGPPLPPPGYDIERSAVALPEPSQEMGLNTLSVPAYEWTFGCSATSASMIAAYYDRLGFSNIYTGPTNGGVMPLDNSAWPSWAGNPGDPYAPYAQCPLAASRNGLDGRTTRGSIDDYWVAYLSTAKDPYITNGWTQHAWGDAIGDYMYTSQSAYSNVDGSTTFYSYNSATPLPCSAMTGLPDGTLGRQNFYLAKGYTVTTCYNQKTDTTISGGFSFAQFEAEIDAGRPVMLNLAGHTIVGIGYDSSSNTVYLHDTWDTSTHTMTWAWGCSYSGMALQSVSIVNIKRSGAKFYVVTPCRLVDTRQTPDTPYLDNGGAGETRTYNFNTTIPYTGTGACSSIPVAAALSLSLQFQVTDQSAYLTAYPDSAALPTATTLVAYNTGLFYVNDAIVPTGADGGVKVFAQYGGQVVIDINGYFK